MTHRDKYINKLSNEEMAEFFFTCLLGRCSYCDYSCKKECEHGDSPNNCVMGIKKWLENEAEQTADEMFEELGYKKSFDGFTGEIEYENKFNSKIRIMPVANGSYHYKKTTHNIADYITEAENKAIIKKIEELKKEE